MTEGAKLDQGKRPWDLFLWGAAGAIIDVLEHGRRKYAGDNWRKVPEPRRRYFAAMMRHLVAWRLGEERDPESNLSHLAHACCCGLFLLELEVGLGPSSAEMDATEFNVKNGFKQVEGVEGRFQDLKTGKIVDGKTLAQLLLKEMDAPRGSDAWDEEAMAKHGFKLYDIDRRCVLDTKNDKLLAIARDVEVVDWAKIREEAERGYGSLAAPAGGGKSP